MNLKTVIIVIISMLLIFTGYKLINNPEKQIRKIIFKIQEELTLTPSDNIVLKSKSILRLADNFSKDFKGNFEGEFESHAIDNAQALKETISWVVVSMAPINSTLIFQSIKIEKKEANIILKASINSCKNAEFNNKTYIFNISLKKINSTWKISKVVQEK